jgi:hypothetical protein
MEEFGHAALGDVRRTQRLVKMAARVLERPSGKITECMFTSAERQGAYDLLTNERVTPRALLDAMGTATVRRCEEHEHVMVVVDGTSLTVTDRARAKDFGSIGPACIGARGLKVIHAMALDFDGVPLGVLDQFWWARGPKKKRNTSRERPLEDKETQHWTNTIASSAATLTQAGLQGWFQIDREGDGYWILTSLAASGHLFTVRSSAATRVVTIPKTQKRSRVGEVVEAKKPRITYNLEVTAGPGRSARTARLHVRTVEVVLEMMEKRSRLVTPVPVNVVDVLEVGTNPKGELPLHWRLLTNSTIANDEDVSAIINGYTYRWSIEELHRVWKSGGCNIEDSQLRAKDRLIKWAIIGIAVAVRIERLKHLARKHPDRLAMTELSNDEIVTLLYMRERQRGGSSKIPWEIPTLGDAVLWIAELGGYTGRSSGGPPGAITIHRGFLRLTEGVAIIEALRPRERCDEC